MIVTNSATYSTKACYSALVKREKRSWVEVQREIGPPNHVCIFELSRDEQRSMMSLYRDVTVVLNKIEFIYVAFFGTLLGLIRNGDFLAHDDDMDFVAISDINRLLGVDWLSLGYQLTVIVPNKQISIHRLRNFRSEWPFLEIFSQHEDMLGRGVAKVLMRDTAIRSYALKCRPGRPVSIRVPDRAEEILDQLYGASWRTDIAGIQTHSTCTKRLQLFEKAKGAVYCVVSGYLLHK